MNLPELVHAGGREQYGLAVGDQRSPAANAALGHEESKVFSAQSVFISVVGCHCRLSVVSHPLLPIAGKLITEN